MPAGGLSLPSSRARKPGLRFLRDGGNAHAKGESYGQRELPCLPASCPPGPVMLQAGISGLVCP